MYAAKDDEIAMLIPSRSLTEGETVTGQINMPDDFTALIVMTENQETISEPLPNGANSGIEFVVGEVFIK